MPQASQRAGGGRGWIEAIGGGAVRRRARRTPTRAASNRERTSRSARQSSVSLRGGRRRRCDGTEPATTAAPQFPDRRRRTPASGTGRTPSRRASRRTPRRPSRCRISAPAPDANTSGTTPMMNATDVMSTGRSRMRQASRIAVDARRALCFPLPRELDDQDGVLARQPREHEKTDLREHVVVAARQPHAGDRREQRHRHDQDHASAAATSSRTAPRARRRRAARTAGRSGTWCCRRSRPDRRARSIRTSCRSAAASSSSVRDGALRLTGTEARRRPAVDFGGRIAVVVHHLIGPVASAHLTARDPSGTISPLRVAGLELRDLLRLHPERRLRLHVHLIRSPEPIEVVRRTANRDRPAAYRTRQ